MPPRQITSPTSIRRAAAALAVAVSISPTSALAQPAGDGPGRVPEGGFAVSGVGDPDAWQFVMGPSGPRAALVLTRVGENGSVLFRCERATGSARLYVWTDADPSPAEAPAAEIAVGSRRAPVGMRPAEAVPGRNPGDPIPLEAAGSVPVDVLAAMALLEEPPLFLTVRPLGADRGPLVRIPVGADRSVHAVSAAICEGWASAARQGPPPPAIPPASVR